MKFQKEINNISYGHLKSEKAVDRHFFLKSKLDDSLLKLLAVLQQKTEIESMNISRLINLLIMKGLDDLQEMESNKAFETISNLNEKFMEL